MGVPGGPSFTLAPTLLLGCRSKEVSGTGFDERDLTWDLQPNSRVGAKVKDGPIGARIEFSPEANKMVRLFYGTWKLGVSTILVGQDYTPVYYPISSQAGRCDAALKGYGVFYAKRIPQLKLTMKGFQVALVQPRATNVVPGAGDTDTSLPKVEASYSFIVMRISLQLVQLKGNTKSIPLFMDWGSSSLLVRCI